MAIKVVGTTVIDDSRNADLVNVTVDGTLKGNPNLTIGESFDIITVSGELTVGGGLDIGSGITIGNSLFDAASADGVGINLGPAQASITYDSNFDVWSFSKSGLFPGVIAEGPSGSAFESIKEKFITSSSTGGNLSVAAEDPGIRYLTSVQTADTNINFTGGFTSGLFTDYTDIGQAVTIVILATQGSTAYYIQNPTVEGQSVTTFWQGGSPPTEGNPNSIDAYTFTLLNEDGTTSGVKIFASLTQFA